jgi:CBS domain-containing protein
MEEFHREEILLVDTLFEGHLLGMITSSSISRLAVAKSVTPSQLNAEQCMEPLVATIGQNVSVDECLRVMEEKNLARIPVVDETGHYCGVVDKEAMELTTL